MAKNNGASNEVPKWAWKILIAISLIVAIATGGGITNFFNHEPKQKLILQGKHGGKSRVPVEVLESGRRRGEPRIRLVVYDYLGHSTWHLSARWEPVGTITLYPSKKHPPYNYGGFWIDRQSKSPIWFKFNNKKTRAVGKVFLYGEWHNCWLKL